MIEINQKITLDSKIKGKTVREIIKKIGEKIYKQPRLEVSHETLIAYELSYKINIPKEKCLKLMAKFIQET